MNWNEFSLEEIVDYINKQLFSGRSMKDIEIIDFKVNERVISKRLNRKGYKKIENQFVKTTDNKKNNKVKVEKSIEIIKNESDDKLMTPVITKEMEHKLLNLIKYHDNIMDLVINFDDAQMTGINTTEIIVKLPKEEDRTFRTTIRVNDVVWNRFKEFCDKNIDFTQKDLLSMALVEYMNKFDK